MSYTKTRGVQSTTGLDTTPGLASHSNSNASISSVTNEFYELEPGEVVDVIYDDQHPQFETYADIGKVKVRLIYSNPNADIKQLPWALPLDSNNKAWPLKHEVVIVGQYPSVEDVTSDITDKRIPLRMFYTTKLNALNSVHHNALLNISLPEKKDDKPDELELGDLFKDKNSIHPLQQYEGDMTYEGRSGQSIRFGHNEEVDSPNIKIRAGQDPNTDGDDWWIPIDENLNDDPSSIWITTNEEVKGFIRASDIHDSIEGGPSGLMGAQIIVNSDRLIFNSKKYESLFLSKGHINMSTGGIFGVDAKSKINLEAPKIYLGLGATEPLVLGEILKEILNDLLTTLVTGTYPTPAGPSGPPIKAAKYSSLQAKLSTILSKRNFTL